MVVHTNKNYEIVVNTVEQVYDVRNVVTGVVEYSSEAMPQAMLVSEQFNRMLTDANIIKAMVDAAYKWTNVNFTDEGILKFVSAADEDMQLN